MTTHTQTLHRGTASGGYVQPICSCGWHGVSRPTQRSIEVFALAERDAKDHGYRHDNGLGFFDYEKGWQGYRGMSFEGASPYGKA